MKKRIIIEEKTNNSKITQDKIIEWIIEWIICTVSYAFVLITISNIFKKTFYICPKPFALYAIIATIIISVLNQTVKPVLVYITLPLTALTYGLFYPVINVIILEITSIILGSKFQIHGIIMPILVAVTISILNFLVEEIIIKPIINKRRRYNE